PVGRGRAPPPGPAGAAERPGRRPLRGPDRAPAPGRLPAGRHRPDLPRRAALHAAVLRPLHRPADAAGVAGGGGPAGRGVTVLDRVFDSDLRVTARMREWHAPSWLAAWMVLASRLGNGWLWLVSTAALVGGPSPWRRLALINAGAALAGNLLQIALKQSFRRPRPGDRAPARYHELLAPDRFSFPSGHALNAALLAVLVGME